MMNSKLVSISMDDLSMVSGGQQGAAPAQPPAPQPPAPQPPAPRPPGSDFAPVQGNVVQQGGQMVDNAAQGWNGARRAGCNWYESLGNAAIGFFGLGGGFAPNGQPRGN
jgi:hypothetical protein